ncbi:protein kinase family protein [Salinibacillus xinjiangensis]|uniref:Phosphotransferase n=1 Tax=Salinibacillus xinjiangensis TaxID=1229268 RepID=A0A6G1XBB9_9BACI|nr:phosphotransferase [Salinibacillus xinjiangensis]MRG88237.1 phosphotransferase [Salinibacillus xinjiangensis]
MRTDFWRDDSFLNRLHSFLKEKGALTVQRIVPIKKNVYEVFDGNQWWIVKCYHRKMSRLWSLFSYLDDESNFIISYPFPNGKRWIEDQKQQIWCMYPYVEGESLSYKNDKDRKSAIHLLQDFHHESKGIVIHQTKPISYLTKLEERQKRFSRTKNIFFQHNALFLYQNIMKYTEELWTPIKKLKWTELEKRAKRKKYIIHGDSASHNFIKNNTGVFLIDFDLIQNAPYEYEWIQLAQRFLYDGVDDWDELLSYPVFQFYVQNPYFYYGLKFPSDLFREWLHFLKRNPSNQEISQYIKKFKRHWHKRQKFYDKTPNYDKISNNNPKRGERFR